MSPDEMDALFAALASEPRRRMLDILKKHPGSNVNHLCEFFSQGRVAVMKHLDVLEAADLVVSEKAGRERLLYFNPVPIQMIYERWTSELGSYWAGKLTRLKYRLENSPIQITKPKPKKIRSQP
jgi:predicted transcriptional regulator